MNDISCIENKLSNKQLSALKLPDSLKVAIVGGSNSVMRDGYTKYFKEHYELKNNCSLELSYFSLGGVTNLFAAIQNFRHKIAQNHDVILFEYCINDRGAIANNKYSLKMAGMVLEGFIRKSKLMNPKCAIIIVIFGTNSSTFYSTRCHTSAVYKSVACHYKIPVVDITEILLEQKGFEFIQQLYGGDDDFHFNRPKGAKIIGQTLAEQVFERKILASVPKLLDEFGRMYSENIEDLKFFCDFNLLQERIPIEKKVFKNSLFKENIYTIKYPSIINLKLKGKLLAIMVKSDWYDGLVKIKLGKQELVISSFSKWVTKEGKNNISLISSICQKFDRCEEFENLTISLCSKRVKEYELDMGKKEPIVNPNEWKLDIIGIAYVGEISTLEELKHIKEMDKIQYNLTEISLKQAIKTDPGNAVYYCELGKIYQNQNQLNKAKIVYKKAIEIEPNWIDIYKYLGNVLIDEKDYASAALIYKQAIKFAPQDEELYSLLGNALISLQRLDLAEKCYRYAIKLNPNKSYYQRCLGDVFKQQKKIDLAIYHYQQALAIAPNNPWIYVYLSEALIEQNKLDEANENCKQSLRFIQPKRVGFYRRVGDLQMKIGSFDDAIDTYKQAIKLNPNHNQKVIEQIRLQLEQAAKAKECNRVQVS